MKGEKFDFYDSSSIKIYNLDQKLRYELMILDNLDAMTKVHCENVGNLTGRICQKLRLNKKFTVYAMICGYLHDIGKAYIPKEILTKDGPLTEEEFEVMKTHTTIGYNVCMRDLKLRPYADGPLYHHEALNGSGYPSGLTQKDITIQHPVGISFYLFICTYYFFYIFLSCILYYILINIS